MHFRFQILHWTLKRELAYFGAALNKTVAKHWSHQLFKSGNTQLIQSFTEQDINICEKHNSVKEKNAENNI